MGYYTGYSLQVKGGDELAIVAELRARYKSAAYAIDENGEKYDACKWYSHKEEMLTFSKLYPDSVFELSGVGEEFPDLWIEYYKNGKVQKEMAQITYTPFDESKLT